MYGGRLHARIIYIMVGPLIVNYFLIFPKRRLGGKGRNFMSPCRWQGNLSRKKMGDSGLPTESSVLFGVWFNQAASHTAFSF